MKLPTEWKELEAEVRQDYFRQLAEYVAAERAAHQVFPSSQHVFAAMEVTPLDAVRVLVLGQDPYHGDGQAHGLSFSVLPGVKIPPSLRNIYKELASDVGFEIPTHGYLMPWAKQGVLMLNSVLTVQAGEANSHRNCGWEKFTDAVIRTVSEKREQVIFVLWGNSAQAKKKLIDTDRHVIVESVHPSPLSASRGFFGSRPFSRINRALRERGETEIDWQLPLEITDHRM